MDDGDDCLEEDIQHFCSDDHLEHDHRFHLQELQHQQLVLQQYIERQFLQNRSTSDSCSHQCCYQHCSMVNSNSNELVNNDKNNISDIRHSPSEIYRKAKTCHTSEDTKKDSNTSIAPDAACTEHRLGISYQSASLKIGRDKSATLVRSSVPQCPHFLRGGESLRRDTNMPSRGATEAEKVSSVIVTNNNAVRVVLDGS